MKHSQVLWVAICSTLLHSFGCVSHKQPRPSAVLTEDSRIQVKLAWSKPGSVWNDVAPGKPGEFYALGNLSSTLSDQTWRATLAHVRSDGSFVDTRELDGRFGDTRELGIAATAAPRSIRVVRDADRLAAFAFFRRGMRDVIYLTDFHGPMKIHRFDKAIADVTAVSGTRPSGVLVNVAAGTSLTMIDSDGSVSVHRIPRVPSRRTVILGGIDSLQAQDNSMLLLMEDGYSVVVRDLSWQLKTAVEIGYSFNAEWQRFPSTVPEFVVISTRRGNIAAYDVNGVKRWATKLTNVPNFACDCIASDARSELIAFAFRDGTVIFVDGLDGTEMGRVDVGGFPQVAWVERGPQEDSLLVSASTAGLQGWTILSSKGRKHSVTNLATTHSHSSETR